MRRQIRIQINMGNRKMIVECSQRLLAFFIATCFAVVLASCGGGSGAGAAGEGSGEGPGLDAGPTPAALEFTTTKNQLSTAGADSTEFQVVAKDSGNRIMPNIAIDIRSTGGTIALDSARTNEQGVVAGRLSVTSGDRSNRTITLTAAAGTVTQTHNVLIEGTTLTGTASLTSVGVGGSVTLMFVLRDKGNQPIAGQSVSLYSALGNPVPASVLTDSTGTATVIFSPTRPGAESISASSAGASSAPIQITVGGDNLSIIVAGTMAADPPAVPQQVSIIFTRDGVPQIGKTVRITATRGILNPGSGLVITNGIGAAQIMLTPNTIGPVTIVADSEGVSGRADAHFVATRPADFEIQANPTTIPANATGSSSQQSTVTARVVDGTVDRNPVSGARVVFALARDSSGGRLLNPTAVTNNNGIASTIFIPGDRPSGTDGVSISASVDGVVGVVKEASLTVAGAALFISIGTNNKVVVDDPLTYKKEFNVRVSDSAGLAVPNARVTARLLPKYYYKGAHGWVGPLWANANLTPPPAGYTGYSHECPNEDLNFDGFIDSSRGEDANGDGKLFPGQVATARPSLAESVLSDENGSIKVTVEYARSFAYWAAYELEVATTVGGSVGRATYYYELAGAAADYNDRAVSPPGASSPFGKDIQGPDPCKLPD